MTCRGRLEPPQPGSADRFGSADANRDLLQDAHDRPALPLPELTGLPAFAPAIDVRRAGLVAMNEECAPDLALEPAAALVEGVRLAT